MTDCTLVRIGWVAPAAAGYVHNDQHLHRPPQLRTKIRVRTKQELRGNIADSSDSVARFVDIVRHAESQSTDKHRGGTIPPQRCNGEGGGRGSYQLDLT